MNHQKLVTTPKPDVLVGDYFLEETSDIVVKCLVIKDFR